ncbi:hypothetical protein K2X33_04295 [bacterium]|nr:hypothetical protein [bacterium]
MIRPLALGLFALSGFAWGVNYPSTAAVPVLEIPVTPFSDMASGYQATNPGFRAVLRDGQGDYIAGGRMTMDAVIKGETDDASQGSAYGLLKLRVDIEEGNDKVAAGSYTGTLSICMAKDQASSLPDTACKSLSGNLHNERPFQWIGKKVDYSIASNGDVTITRYYGSTGEGGTSRQLALSVFHPAYGFAAPGKAFKDYQSPLVLDLDHSGKLELVNVWAPKPEVRFDLNGSGDKVRTGWVKATDGFLFQDNGTGCVTNGTQLFGEFTGSKDGKRTFENGFAALAALDTQKTGKVVAKDHPTLKIWIDRNQDGTCTKNEVLPATRHVKEIAVTFEAHANPALNEDNEVRLTSRYTATDGKQYLVGDVWFKQRRNEMAKK